MLKDINIFFTVKYFVKILFILFLFIGCNDSPLRSSENGTDQFHSSKVTDELNIELDLKPKEISNLHDIEAEFTLKNISPKKITYGFPSGCQSGYEIKREQHIILNSTKNLACTMALSSLNLKPGESQTIPISPESRNNKHLEKGNYILKAFLLEDHGVEISTSFVVK